MPWLYSSAIFVTAIDTRPLAPDPAVVVAQDTGHFAIGLDVLTRLTKGSVWLCTGPDWRITLPGIDRVRRATFIGPHPAGLPGTHMHFLDQTDYNQYSLPLEDVADQANYMTEELEGMLALIYNDECVGIQLPTCVELTIVECEPGVKGNSATSRTKPARLETGLEVQVPEYISQGTKIKVDTRSGEYSERVKA